jgi:hypothetical protein
MAAALAAMGGGGEAPSCGELNGVDESDIHLALIEVNPALISHDGELHVAVAAQPMDGDDELAVAPAALAAAGGAGGGGGGGDGKGDAARVPARLHAIALLQQQQRERWERGHTLPARVTASGLSGGAGQGGWRGAVEAGCGRQGVVPPTLPGRQQNTLAPPTVCT